MATAPQKDLPNNVGEILRRAEAGEEITITPSGREVARLVPAHRRRWVSGPALQAIWQTPSPQGLDADPGADFATIDGLVDARPPRT